MVEVRMSLLAMSLLAITLAAIAHAARLDPSLNSASGTGGEFIPYLECIVKCDECTTCTRMLPMWKNVCICVNHTKSAISEKPALQSSEKLNEKIPESISVPIYECEEKCVKCTACTLMLPWWVNTCVCIPKVKPSADGSGRMNPIAAAGVVVQQAPIAEPELFPYAECDEKCKVACACALIWPPPKYCSCSDPIKSSISKKPALQNSGGDDKQIVLWSKAKMETLPYKECIATCEQCACTLIYPPELAICFCLAPKPQAAGGKALPM